MKQCGELFALSISICRKLTTSCTDSPGYNSEETCTDKLSAAYLHPFLPRLVVQWPQQQTSGSSQPTDNSHSQGRRFGMPIQLPALPSSLGPLLQQTNLHAPPGIGKLIFHFEESMGPSQYFDIGQVMLSGLLTWIAVKRSDIVAKWVGVANQERIPSTQPTHHLSVADLLANNLHCENSLCPVLGLPGAPHCS